MRTRRSAWPKDVYKRQHLDYLLRRALEEGIDPITAIQMVTINTAQCYQMDHELGSITPGKCADIVFLKDLEHMEVTRVLIDGSVAAQNGQMCVPIPPYTYPCLLYTSSPIPFL